MRATVAALRTGARRLLPLVLLLGCAAPVRTATPDSFPLHATDQLFTFHWALERGGGVVRAAGVVETRLQTVEDVTLVLYGLDKDGRIVSRGFGGAHWGFRADEIRPFMVQLRPQGAEARYELRVWLVSSGNFRGGRA